ncbi:Centromere protein 3 [Neolecta irregularis DAH-3]|uniref:CENP-C homolog n=1 Tax=Neolecta irregularis (strain DAH-3) TaxID=1198029 RepID=A0A1U7LU03_NEOID|nr:Centromere protein 3 [Neolecta irregularis DAH-3]|eukprot:OLL26022.1 Centromere protein 3 [Neolecta irregularis DAH-3]
MSHRSNQFNQVGIVGRKTGLTVADTGRRDSAGLEDLDGFFSPNKPAQSSSMDIQNSSIQDPAILLAQRSNHHRQSPVRTSLNSPALRVSSTARILLRSPQRNTPINIARKIDFVGLKQKPSSSISRPLTSDSIKPSSQHSAAKQLPSSPSKIVKPIAQRQKSLMSANPNPRIQDFSSDEDDFSMQHATTNGLFKFTSDQPTQLDDNDDDNAVLMNASPSPKKPISKRANRISKSPARQKKAANEPEIISDEDVRNPIPKHSTNGKKKIVRDPSPEPVTDESDQSARRQSPKNPSSLAKRKATPARPASKKGQTPESTQSAKYIQSTFLGTKLEPKYVPNRKKRKSVASEDDMEQAGPPKKGKKAANKSDSEDQVEQSPGQRGRDKKSPAKKIVKDTMHPPPKKARGRPPKNEESEQIPGKKQTNGRGKKQHIQEDNEETAIRSPAKPHRARPVSNKRRGSLKQAARQVSEIRQVPPPSSLVGSTQEDGCRRSTRTKLQPLEYWRNERVVYALGARRESGPALPAIKEIVRYEPHEPETRSKRHVSRKRKKHGQPDDDDDDNDEHNLADKENWENKDEVIADVLCWPQCDQVEMKRIAIPNSAVQTNIVANRTFTFKKIFEEGDFCATGILEINPDGEKPAKQTRNNVLIFVILNGCVAVTINQTEFRLKRGGQFIVPRGNSYRIKNMLDRPARLQFTQVKNTYEDLENGVDTAE